MMKSRQPRQAAKLSPEALRQAAECLRALAHPHRLQAIQLLLAERHTVGELAEACGVASHQMSEHLRLMQRCGFLTATKVGRKAYYQVAEPHLEELLNCISRRFAAA